MRSYLISFIGAVSLLFSCFAFADELSAEVIKLNDLKIIEHNTEDNSAIVSIGFKNIGKKKHYLIAVHSPIAKQSRLYRVNQKTERQHLTHRVPLPHEEHEQREQDNVLIKLTGLQGDLTDNELLFLFADGSSQSVNIKEVFLESPSA